MKLFCARLNLIGWLKSVNTDPCFKPDVALVACYCPLLSVSACWGDRVDLQRPHVEAPHVIVER